MAADYESFRREEDKLRDLLVSSSADPPIATVEGLIELGKRASRGLGSLPARADLRRRLLFWANYVARETREFPDIDLEPIDASEIDSTVLLEASVSVKRGVLQKLWDWLNDTVPRLLNLRNRFFRDRVGEGLSQAEVEATRALCKAILDVVSAARDSRQPARLTIHCPQGKVSVRSDSTKTEVVVEASEAVAGALSDRLATEDVRVVRGKSSAQVRLEEPPDAQSDAQTRLPRRPHLDHLPKIEPPGAPEDESDDEPRSHSDIEMA